MRPAASHATAAAGRTFVDSKERNRTAISYHHVREFPGWAEAPNLLRTLIEANRPKTVIEIGSGAWPTLDVESTRRFQLRYITSDSEAAELEKAPSGFEARVVDVEHRDPPADLVGQCDLVFSRMVNEHIEDGERYHANLLRMLAPGGLAVHCFATLYTLPFLANAVLSSGVSAKLLDLVVDREHHSKFPAHYSWSRGPTRGALNNFRRIGYEIVSYQGYFGHWYYAKRLRPLHQLEMVKARLLLALPMPLFCSYAVVILRRPHA